MLTLLPESAARSRRSPLAIGWSVLLHLSLVAAATAASAGGGRATVPPLTDRVTEVAFPVQPRMPPTRAGGGTSTGDAPTTSQSPSVPAPITIPVGVPPIDLSAPQTDWTVGGPVVDAEDFGRRTGGDAHGGGGDGPGASYASRPERLAAALPGNPRPRYPDIVRAAAIEGTVLIDCVVDTTGTIDLRSVRVIASDHEAFTAAVREVLPQLRFVPAETGGRTVRQWVRIPFEFRLTR